MLPKYHRLRRERDIARVQRSRLSARGHLFTIYVRGRHDADPSRFGIVVGRRVSPKATERNALTRQIRAFVFGTLPSIQRGADVLIVSSKRFSEYEQPSVRRELKHLFHRLHLFEP